MRIENNNNVSFGAYFKNNRLFKNAYLDANEMVDKALLDKFVKECPNHEIEITSIDGDHLGNKLYTIFNNMTGKTAYVDVKEHQNPIDKIMSFGLNVVKNFEENDFWGNTSMIDMFKMLTGVK